MRPTKKIIELLTTILGSGSRGFGTGAVIHLVYIAAIILGVGNAVWLGGKPQDGFVVDGDLCRKDTNAAITVLWLSGCTPERQTFVISGGRSHQWKCFADTTTYAGWRVIPGTYVIAKKDLMPKMIAAAPQGHRFEEVSSMMEIILLLLLVL
ncbi:hypothetical protein F5Y16DRAFT_24697 [Xylariaceae sp. FL0255]|nr:hypothetical protein F5Y16DRAFT_24697 [Xylariaceae sp. FL0255]